MTAASTPAAAWGAFAAAIAARDPVAARRAATEGAWRRHGDSAALVYQTATEEGFRLSASGPVWIEGDRAVLQVAIELPGRSAPLYVLLERREGSWSVSAGDRDERHASLFLAGVLPAVFEVPDLGPSPEGEQWARARSEELRASAVDGASVEIVGVHALPQRGRAVVGLRRRESGRPVEDWVCLDTGDGAPREIRRSSYPSLGLLLEGVSATLPAREAPAPGGVPAAGLPEASLPAASLPEAGLDAEGWKIVNAFLQGLAEIARTTSPPADPSGRAPQVLADAIASALESAGRHPEAAALQQAVAAQLAAAGAGDRAAGTGDRAAGTGDSAPRTGDSAPGTELELPSRDAPEPMPRPSQDPLEPVRQELQREIDAFRNEKGIAAETSLLDAPLLAEHGQELSGRLLRVLANALPRLRPAAQDAPASGPDRSS